MSRGFELFLAQYIILQVGMQLRQLLLVELQVHFTHFDMMETGFARERP